MRTALALGAAGALGVAWVQLGVRLMGGTPREALALPWLAAGVVAGLVAGVHTLRTRTRTGGTERVTDVVATYYLAMFTHWIAFVVVARAERVLRVGRWTDFDLADHLRLIVSFVTLGTLPYGLLLIPLTWLSRALVWRLARRD